MNESQSIFDLSGPELFALCHPVPYIWWAGTFFGLCYGIYRYGRSLKYLYYYYIEHGIVIWSMDGRSRREEMQEVVKRNNLYEYFTPHGYVTGLGFMVLFTALGWLVGVLYPIAIVIGILTIPNLTLRWVAKEKRAKAVFQQNLQGKANGNA